MCDRQTLFNIKTLATRGTIPSLVVRGKYIIVKCCWFSSIPQLPHLEITLETLQHQGYWLCTLVLLFLRIKVLLCVNLNLSNTPNTISEKHFDLTNQQDNKRMNLSTQLPEKTCPLDVSFFKHAWVHMTLQYIKKHVKHCDKYWTMKMLLIEYHINLMHEIHLHFYFIGNKHYFT